MEKRDSRGVFAVLVSSFDELDLLLQKMLDCVANESKSSAYSSYEYVIQSAFKAFRGAYNVLITYARDILVGDDKNTADKLKIIDQRHSRLVYQTGRFEGFMRLCRLYDCDDISLFDFGEGFTVRAYIKNGTEKPLK